MVGDSGSPTEEKAKINNPGARRLNNKKFKHEESTNQNYRINRFGGR